MPGDREAQWAWRAIAAAVVCALLIAAAVLSLPSVAGLTRESGEASRGRAEPVPVVLLVFDELPVISLMDRRGAIDRHLFPNFAAFQDTATWYRNATAMAELTTGSLPSILTGLEPEELGLSLGGRIPRSLFTMLEDTHEVRASRAFPTLCDPDVCRAQTPVDPGKDLPLSVFGSEPRGRGFVSFLHQLEPAERPCVCVLQMVMPHSPWRYLPTGQQYPGTDPMPGQIESPGPGRRWIQDPWLVQLAQARHLMQVGFVDRLLGLVMERLRQDGIFDDAAIAITADHGIAFRPDAHKRAATPATLGEVAYVPLMFKSPGQVSAAVVDEPVELIDLVPTIADDLGLRDAGTFDGISLHQPEPLRTRRMGGEWLDNDGAERDDALKRKFQTFPALRSWDDLLALAPAGARGWVGQRVTRYSAGAASASITRPVAIETAAATDQRIPSLIEGRLVGSDPGRSNVLLLALDGEIVAGTQTYAASGEERFYALVPPAAYVDPPHRLQIFRLTPDDRLVEVALTPAG